MNWTAFWRGYHDGVYEAVLIAVIAVVVVGVVYGLVKDAKYREGARDRYEAYIKLYMDEYKVDRKSAEQRLKLECIKASNLKDFNKYVKEN